MDSLDALADAMNDVAANPFSYDAHLRHVRIAQQIEGMEQEAASALDMMAQVYAVPDEIWLPLLHAKARVLDLETEAGILELFSLYARAETDYLSIPVLQKHLSFLVEKHAHYASEDNIKPEALGDIFNTAWTRNAIAEVVGKGIIHLTEGQSLWNVQKDWELEILETTPESQRSELVEHVQQFFLARLQQTHSDMEDTLQSYSSFTTNYLPSHKYESEMVSASQLRGQCMRNYNRREPLEIKLRQSQYSLEAYSNYIGYERRAKHPDLAVTRGIYERAIAEAAKRKFKGEGGADDALGLLWSGYCDTLRILDAGVDLELNVYRRAARSAPGSGEVWARYIRFLERLTSLGVTEGIESVADVYSRATEAGILQTQPNQLIPVILARGGFDWRRVKEGNEDEDALPTLIAFLEEGIKSVYQVSPAIDPTLRLEKFLISIYESAGLIDSTADVWTAAAKHSKASYQVWIAYTETLIKHAKLDEARLVFVDIHTKQLDWPEAIWEAWTQFEHTFGSVEDIETALDKIEKARYQTNSRRAKEAEQAYQSTQVAEAQAVEFIESVASTSTAPMEVDPAPVSERGTKRSANEDFGPETHKKSKTEPKPPPLKRDRENSTVFVSDLPKGSTEDDLASLFKDCGAIREVKITQLSSETVAAVEFSDRESVPAALTKDKKRILGQEISVHLAWKSTLYVTNFPESTDDSVIRNLFSKYGTIFDVRWPSKKFKATRRFCYVQFTNPNSAEKSLQLHGKELEANLPLNVYISNPERKKERTDADANEREIYVAGLSRYTNKEDLEKLFKTYGPVKDVRIEIDEAGHAKGYAFIEFEDPSAARAALSANNHELKKRRISVTLADPRMRAKHRPVDGLSKTTNLRNRSVYISNIPPNCQEGLLQQVLEKIVPVKRLEVFHDKHEAVVELENAADVGRLLLRQESVIFGGNNLIISEQPPTSQQNKAPANAGPSGLFKPRTLGPSKPKAGLGFKKTPVVGRSEGRSSGIASTSSSAGGGKGQDDFRKMLAKK